MSRIPPREHERVFIGMGSNVGDRLAHLQSAVAALQAEGVFPVESSSVYESPAHVLEGAEPEADYLNAVLEVKSDLSPGDLLGTLTEVERRRGRERAASRRWAARTLDLDILLYGARSFSDPSLTIPHPRIAERRFVLEPLAEIDSSVIVPQPHQEPVHELLRRCPDATRIRKVFPPESMTVRS